MCVSSVKLSGSSGVVRISFAKPVHDKTTTRAANVVKRNIGLLLFGMAASKTQSCIHECQISNEGFLPARSTKPRADHALLRDVACCYVHYALDTMKALIQFIRLKAQRHWTAITGQGKHASSIACMRAVLNRHEQRLFPQLLIFSLPDPLDLSCTIAEVTQCLYAVF